jgi:general secretion pathway protein D
MKTIHLRCASARQATLALILFLTAFDLLAQTNTPPRHRPKLFGPHGLTNAIPDESAPANPPPAPTAPGLPVDANLPSAPPATPSGADASAAPASSAPQEEMIPAGNINFQGVDVNQVLDVYAKLVGRTLLRAGLPSAQIVLKTETPLTKAEAIEALQAVLALNGISVVNIGDKFVKVGTVEQANTFGAEFNDAAAGQLPDLGAYVTHIVQLKNVKPSEMVPILTPFAKLPNSIVPIENNGILVLRDNAENVKRMLQMIDRVDVSVPAEYISEVIPIKYALADDIATALNSLGGTGSGGTVRIGTSANSTSGGGNGFANPSGGGGGALGGGNNGYQNGNGLNGGLQRGQTGGLGATGNGTPTGGASSFQQRLQSIIARASNSGGQQDQIQLFGQTKIIADERSNSLLIFATRQDMAMIKGIVDKLDVLLSQVLIESVIMEVSLGKSLNTGVSVEQNPGAISSPNFKGTGGYLNGPSFFNFVTNSSISNLGTNLAGGLSYFGQIGNADYDLAIQAAASDNNISIIQKPRIQTFQAQKASFFVGQTVPYVTGSTYGSAYGNSSSYSQLSVGVELDVTPFINPDGLVVMEINEEIDDINGSTYIQGVGDIPNTDKRTLSSQVAVKDRDTIILGGAIRSQKSFNRSGVPLLQDIPLLGALFSSQTRNKTRDELLVLMRPTVLKTPELAALQAKTEEARLPGIAHAEAQDNKEELKQVQSEEKVEQIQAAREARAAAKAEKNGTAISTNAPSSGMPDAGAAPDVFTNPPPDWMPAPTISTNVPPKSPAVLPAVKAAPVVPTSKKTKTPIKAPVVMPRNSVTNIPAASLNTSSTTNNPAAGLY